MNRFWRSLPVLVVAAFVVAPPASAALKKNPLLDDFGQYLVYAGKQQIGTERFSLEPQGDSVVVFADLDEMLPTPDGPQRMVKKASIIIKLLDYDVLGYTSEQDFLGRQLLRGLVIGDTAFTAYREISGRGAGDRMLRPPGRMFVIDPQVFTLFDILLRSLHGKLLGERPVPVVLLGEPRDSVLDITVKPGGTEMLHWGGRVVPARKIALTDGTSEFMAWVSSSGRMLRLEQQVSGLRVERDPHFNQAEAARAPVSPGLPDSSSYVSPAMLKPRKPPGR